MPLKCDDSDSTDSCLLLTNGMSPDRTSTATNWVHLATDNWGGTKVIVQVVFLIFENNFVFHFAARPSINIQK